MREDDSDPPQKGGFLPAPIEVLRGSPLSGPIGSLSSVFIPAGRLGKDAPERRPEKCLFVSPPSGYLSGSVAS